MFDNRIKIGKTQGDTNGIGWEVILKSLANPMMVELCTPVVYGNRKAAEFYMSRIDWEDMEPLKFFYCSSAEEARYGAVNFVEVGEKELYVDAGKATEAAAKAAIAALEAVAKDLDSGALAAVVTAPISKESMNSVGFGFTGHTEFFENMIVGAADEDTRLLDTDVVYKREVFLLCADPRRDLGELVAESHTSLYRFSVLFGIYEKFALTDKPVRTAQTGEHFINVFDLLCGIRCAGLLSVAEGRIRDPDITGHIEGYAAMVERDLRNFIIGIKLPVQIRLLYILQGIFIL